MSECQNCGAPLHFGGETCSRECQDVLDEEDPAPAAAVNT